MACPVPGKHKVRRVREPKANKQGPGDDLPHAGQDDHWPRTRGGAHHRRGAWMPCGRADSQDYIKQLINVLNQAEDLESINDLHALCSLMQTIRG